MTDSTVNAPRTVILHASSAPGDVQRAIGSGQTIRDAHPELNVRVIVNGEALVAVTDGTPIEPPEGVQVQACRLRMAWRDLPVSSLPESVGTVPAAVTAIVEAQLDGAVYVRI